MVTPRERQGYLGDLAQKSIDELQYLLQRQENLVANTKFISQLPDKGAKIREMITKIKQALADHKNVDETADLFQSLAIQSEKARSTRKAGGGEEGEEDGEERMLRRLATRGQDEKVVVDEREELNPESPKVMNSYEKIMKRVEKRPVKNKFIPNRSLKTKEVSELISKMDTLEMKRDIVNLTPTKEETSQNGSERLQPSSDQSKPTNSKSSPQPKKLQDMDKDSSHQSEGHHGRLKHRYDELLEEKLYTGESHCLGAKMINVDDSMQLMREQQHKIEAIQAKHAAEKLAERLHVKMDTFLPEGSSAHRYRDVEGQTLDSDDDEVDDYPD